MERDSTREQSNKPGFNLCEIWYSAREREIERERDKRRISKKGKDWEIRETSKVRDVEQKVTRRRRSVLKGRIAKGNSNTEGKKNPRSLSAGKKIKNNPVCVCLSVCLLSLPLVSFFLS